MFVSSYITKNNDTTVNPEALVGVLLDPLDTGTFI